MACYYHVDRTGRLTLGQTLELVCYDDIQPSFLQTHVDGLFPDGLTHHGERYLLRPDSGVHMFDPALELVWELTRRVWKPAAPSRYQAVFGWESLEDARRFRDAHSPEATIWELEANGGFRADMNLLKGVSSVLVASHFAKQYWAGAKGPLGEACWEILLVPPVKVVRPISAPDPGAEPSAAARSLL